MGGSKLSQPVSSKGREDLDVGMTSLDLLSHIFIPSKMNDVKPKIVYDRK